MDLAQRKTRTPSRSTHRAVYQWALAAGVAAALAYGGVAAATLADVSDSGPVTSLLDAAWPHWLAALAVAVFAGALAQVLTHAARPRPVLPPAEQRPALADQRRGSLAWVLPATTMLAAILLVRLYYAPLAALIGAAAVFASTVVTIVVHYHLRSEHVSAQSLAGIALNISIHAGAFFLLTMIYSFKYRSMYSATAIGLATLLLLLQLTDGEQIAWLRRLLYALVGGLLLGQATWALNYWAASGPVGGALLLVVFYFISGLTLHASRDSLGRRVVIEYSAVCAVAFLITAVAVTAYR
jgi:hypothetical protein